MRIYLASSFKFKDHVDWLARQLEGKGHRITRKWWETDFKKEGPTRDEEWYKHPVAHKAAEANFRGIDKAHVLIMVMVGSQDCVPAIRFKGAGIEAGYAYGQGIPVLMYGHFLRSAMYVPFARITRFYGILHWLNTLYHCTSCKHRKDLMCHREKKLKDQTDYRSFNIHHNETCAQYAYHFNGVYPNVNPCNE